MRTGARIGGYAVLVINAARALLLLVSGFGLLLGISEPASGALRDTAAVLLSFLGAAQMVYAIVLGAIVYGLYHTRAWAWYALLAISVIEVFRIFNLAWYAFVALGQLYLLLFEKVFPSSPSSTEESFTPPPGRI